MTSNAPSDFRREAHAICMAFLVAILGLAIMLGSVAPMEPHQAKQSDQHRSAIVNVAAMSPHECPTSSGSLGSHCHLQYAVPASGSGNAPVPIVALGSHWVRLELSCRTQHRPSGLLRPPNAVSQLA